MARDYLEGEVPDDVILLTAGLDVQEGYFMLLIRGWGYFESSGLIRALRIEGSSWNGVEAVLLNTSYKSRKGEIFSPVLACIDTGYRTSEVYNFCSDHNDICSPVKGVAHLPGAPYTVSRIDRFPKTGAVIPGGLALYKIDTNFYKDKVARMMDCRPEDLSQWYLHKDPHDQYLKQVTAEEKVLVRDKKSRRMISEWRKKSRALPNHFWDCEVYATAAADMLYVSTLRPEDSTAPAVYEPKRESGFIKRSGSWAGERKGWIR